MDLNGMNPLALMLRYFALRYVIALLSINVAFLNIPVSCLGTSNPTKNGASSADLRGYDFLDVDSSTQNKPPGDKLFETGEHIEDVVKKSAEGETIHGQDLESETVVDHSNLEIINIADNKRGTRGAQKLVNEKSGDLTKKMGNFQDGVGGVGALPQPLASEDLSDSSNLPLSVVDGSAIEQTAAATCGKSWGKKYLIGCTESNVREFCRKCGEGDACGDKATTILLEGLNIEENASAELVENANRIKEKLASALVIGQSNKELKRGIDYCNVCCMPK